MAAAADELIVHDESYNNVLKRQQARAARAGAPLIHDSAPRKNKAYDPEIFVYESPIKAKTKPIDGDMIILVSSDGREVAVPEVALVSASTWFQKVFVRERQFKETAEKKVELSTYSFEALEQLAAFCLEDYQLNEAIADNDDKRIVFQFPLNPDYLMELTMV